jgi:hypothetical protein
VSITTKKLAIIAKVEKFHRNSTGLVTEITFTDGTKLALIPLNMQDVMPDRLKDEHFDYVFVDALTPEDVKHQAAHTVHARNDDEEEGTIETL